MSREKAAVAPWLLVEAFASDSEDLLLDREESRHLKGALRRRVGDRIMLTDGRGSMAEAVVLGFENSRARCAIEQLQFRGKPASACVEVALAVLHGRAMDWAVQKAVEVGAARFVPILAERSQLDRKAAAGRRPHWHRVAQQALKQCRRSWSMEVDEPIGLADFCASRAPGVVADAQGETVETLGAELAATLLVGPEGGFTAAESELVDRVGWRRLRLGPHVLRAETAVVLGIGFLQAREERRLASDPDGRD